MVMGHYWILLTIHPPTAPSARGHPPHVGPVLDRAPVIVPTPYITDYSITRWNGDWQSTSHYGQWQFPLGNRVVYDFLNEIGIFLGFEQDGMGP